MKNKIIFLDASTVDYGDIDFSPISSICDYEGFDNISPKDYHKCRSATILITNKVIIDKLFLDNCPGVRHIAVAATGYNNIDPGETAGRGITVSNVPGYSTDSVAQLTMSFIFALSSNIIKYDRAVHDGKWTNSDIFTLGDWPVIDLIDKTIGICGMGAIGSKVAQMCSSLGMKVIALKRGNTAYDNEEDRFVLEELAGLSDFISIHMPLSDYSRNMFHSGIFSIMKKSAFLINVARGPIISSHDLAHALNNNIIAGAALDVLDKEPPPSSDPLLTAKNCIITPHIAWASRNSRKVLIEEIGKNIRAHIRGEERNIVS